MDKIRIYLLFIGEEMPKFSIKATTLKLKYHNPHSV